MYDEYITMYKNDIQNDDLLKSSYFDKLKNTEIGSQSECKLTINEIGILIFSNMDICEQIDKYMILPDYFKYYSSCIIINLKIRQNCECLNFNKIKSCDNNFFQLFKYILNKIDDQQIKINFYKKYVSQIHKFYFDEIFNLSIDELFIQQIIGLADASNNTPLIYNTAKSNQIISEKIITIYGNLCRPLQTVPTVFNVNLLTIYIKI
jgi:hypothetical protein